MVDLSIVIPALNERENLGHLFPPLQRVLRSLGLSSEILVIDGGSLDGTPEAAAAVGARVIRQAVPGFGSAIWTGIKASRGEWTLTMDADGSHDPWYIPSLYEKRLHADVVVASRYVARGGAECATYRDVLSRVLNRFSGWVFSLPLRDYSGGFKLYRRSIFEDFELESRDFNVQIEALMKAIAFGHRVIEVPYTYKERRTGMSHAKILRYGASFLRTILRLYRLRNTLYFCDYDERAFRSRIPLQRVWHRSRYEILKEWLEPVSPVLDAGCGSGHFILAHPEAIGLDRDLRKARFIRECHARTVVGSIRELPFPSGTFGQVISSEVIEHIPGKRAVLEELVRMVRPGGALILSTPDYGQGPWRAIESVYKLVMPGAYADDHVSRFDSKELVDLLGDLGMQVEVTRRMFGSIFFVKARAKANLPTETDRQETS